MKLVPLAAVLFAVALSACTGTRVAPTTPSLALGSAPLGAVSGGSVGTSHGDTVTIPANALASDQNVSVSFDPNATDTPPNPAWSVAHGVLTIGLPGGMKSGNAGATYAYTSAPAGMHVSMIYGPAESSAIESAAAPLVTLTTATGSNRVVIHGTFDVQKNTVAIDIPQPMLAGVTSVKIALGETNAAAQATAFGGKLWVPGLIYGGTWEPFTTWSNNARTLIVIHGIFSSVETAYSCANNYLSTTADGDSTAPYSYQQIFGFDYDFAQPPAVEAALFAKFINSLSLSNYDIEAHSYGTLVTLATLPQLTSKPNRTVLVGGPLPLRGSPIANPKNVLLRDLLLTLAAETISSPAQIDEAIQSGMVASLGTNSSTLQQILSGVKSLTPYPTIERVAGTEEYSVEQLFWWALIPAGVDVHAWDGVVEESAAQSSDLTASRQTTIPDAHMGEPCDQPTIDFVTQQQ